MPEIPLWLTGLPWYIYLIGGFVILVLIFQLIGLIFGSIFGLIWGVFEFIITLPFTLIGWVLDQVKSILNGIKSLFIRKK